MPLTPAQMGTAILRNLATKTGHPLAYWLDVLRELNAPDAKTARAGLKAAGLGHFQAQAVYRASQNDFPYDDPQALVDTLFPPGTEIRAGYEAFTAACAALGEVRLAPCRTYVPCYAARKFATVRPAGDGLAVALALPGEAKDHPLLSGRSAGGDARLDRTLHLPPSGAMTAEQTDLLHRAYTANR